MKTVVDFNVETIILRLLLKDLCFEIKLFVCDGSTT